MIEFAKTKQLPMREEIFHERHVCIFREGIVLRIPPFDWNLLYFIVRQLAPFIDRSSARGLYLMKSVTQGLDVDWSRRNQLREKPRPNGDVYI